jgi:hypothetical protein
MAIPAAILENVLQHFIKENNLRLTGPKRSVFDEHRAFFVWRRAALLGEIYSAWVTEADHDTLKKRIASEFQAIEDFIAKHIGTLCWTASPGAGRQRRHQPQPSRPD